MHQAMEILQTLKQQFPSMLVSTIAYGSLLATMMWLHRRSMTKYNDPKEKP